VVPLPVSPADESEAGGSAFPSGKKVRRRKKNHQGEDHEWDRSQKSLANIPRREKRQMFWMLVGGSCLFALIVAVVLVAMLRVTPPPPLVVAVPPAAEVAEVAEVAESPISDAAFRAEAQPMAEKFLNATRIDDLLPLVRNPVVAESRIRKFYSEGTIESAGMSAFDTRTDVVHEGVFLTIRIRTRDFEEKPLTFITTPEGLRIDWESWVGWSDMPWEEFLAEKPTVATRFRVNLGPVDYYNFAFSDDRKWRSYRLESPDGEHAIYGYAERDTPLDGRLRLPPDIKQARYVLSLRFPENATANNQVIIHGMSAEGWALETEDAP
jgi:hypothetical protein